MKVSVYKYLSLLLLLLINVSFVSASTTATSQEFVKEINKSFSLNANGRLELANRHGQINIISWDKDQVDIDIRIIVQAHSQEDANSVFERVRIDFSDNPNMVSAMTQIGTGNRSWWEKLTGGWGGSSDDFKIIYDVKMPSRAFLKANAMYCNISCGDHLGGTDIYAKYGNVNLGELGDDCQLEVGYGNAKVKALNGSARVRIGYGDLDIDHASQDLEVEARYGDFRIESAQSLQLNSRYTDCVVGKVDRLRLNGSYGDIRIDDVQELRASTTYLGYEVDKVWKKLDITTAYGDVEVDWVGAGFSEVRFKGSYSDIELRIDEAAGYEVEARTSYADIDMPNSVELSRREHKSNAVSMSGRKSGKGNGRMSLSSSYGDIEIME